MLSGRAPAGARLFVYVDNVPAGEAAVAQRIVQELEAIGLTVEVQEVAPGRPNVVGTLAGRAPGRSLMLCGHIDTVGVAGMATPFEPVAIFAPVT